MGRRRNGLAGCRTPRRFPSPHKRTNQASIVVECFAARRAHPARDRARAGSRCGARGVAARCCGSPHCGGGWRRGLMLGLKPERFDLGEFMTQPITLCGKSFLADQSGALYWPVEKTLIVADLHLEKGSAHASRGTFLPPYDTRQTLLRLAEVIDRLESETVIALGDSFHDGGAAERLCDEDLQILKIIQEDRRWIWITGNHDPSIPEEFGGQRFEEFDLGGIKLRHEPRPGGITHEIAGHMHPAARISIHGTSIR